MSEINLSEIMRDVLRKEKEQEAIRRFQHINTERSTTPPAPKPIHFLRLTNRVYDLEARLVKFKQREKRLKKQIKKLKKKQKGKQNVQS